MGAPQPKSAIPDYVSYNLYVVAKLEADPVVAALAEPIQASHDGLMGTVAARNAAHNAKLKAEAKADKATEDLVDTLEPLMNDAASTAVFKSKDHPDFARIFQHTAAQYEGLAQKDQPQALADLRKELLEDETPAALKKLAKPFVDAHDAYLKAQGAFAKTEDSLKKATKKIDEAKIKCLEASAKLRGQLGVQFPRQPKKVARYFPRGARTQSGPKPDKETPQPMPAPEPGPEDKNK